MFLLGGVFFFFLKKNVFSDVQEDINRWGSGYKELGNLVRIASRVMN